MCYCILHMLAKERLSYLLTCHDNDICVLKLSFPPKLTGTRRLCWLREKLEIKNSKMSCYSLH